MPSDEGHRFPLSHKRFLTVSTFKGKVRVDIREFYLDKQGDQRPGKKGISLSLEEWEAVKRQLDDVDKAVRKQDSAAKDSESESD